MMVLNYFSLFLLAAFIITSVVSQSRHHFNPTIIQDSRLEPNADGTFGFLYRTEDGISHAAKGDPTGFIQGSYSYKDPTGLKVNFNYFAGAKKNSNSAPTSAARTIQYQETVPQYRNPEPRYIGQEENQQQYYPTEPEPYQPTQEYRPRTRPPASYTRPQAQEYRPPSYNARYSSNTPLRRNEVYDVNDYQYKR